MAIYNEGKFLRQALDSLLAQDYADFELIISDNASEDATQQICLEYATRDARVRYYRNETNLGSPENFNRAFRLSSGEYFMWAGGHDLWAPAFISRCVGVLEKDPSVVLCYPQVQYIDRTGKQLTVVGSNLDTRNRTLLARFNLTVWEGGYGFTIYGVIRANCLRQTRLFRRVWGPDVLLLSELSILGSFANIPEPLFYGRDNWGEKAGPNTNNWTKPYLERLFPGKKYRFMQFFPHAGFSYEQLLAVMHARLGFKAKIPLITFVVLGLLYKSLPLILRRPLRGFLRRLLRIISVPSRSGQLV
jgi:glycosyltransferase involved in cell wall biosynthesis